MTPEPVDLCPLLPSPLMLSGRATHRSFRSKRQNLAQEREAESTLNRELRSPSDVEETPRNMKVHRQAHLHVATREEISISVQGTQARIRRTKKKKNIPRASQLLVTCRVYPQAVQAPLLPWHLLLWAGRLLFSLCINKVHQTKPHEKGSPLYRAKGHNRKCLKYVCG